MKFQKAVFVDVAEGDLDNSYWEELDQAYDKKVYVSRADLMGELSDCDALFLGFQIPIGKDVFEAAPNLKFINILATAYGTVDLEEASKRNIPVCNLAGYSTEAVAEFTISVLLYHIRQFKEGMKRSAEGNYDFSGMSARELKNSNFGVVGLGSIGGRVAELAAGFDAKVSYWSRKPKDVPFKYKELNALLSESDYISLNVAQTPETEKLLNAETIALLKPGAVVINTVPPEVVDTGALVARLEKGDIFYVSDHGDEMSKEELDKINKFDNCLLLPAIGFITQEARINKQEIFIANTTGFLNGTIQNKVN